MDEGLEDATSARNGPNFSFARHGVYENKFKRSTLSEDILIYIYDKDALLEILPSKWEKRIFSLR